MTGLGGACPAPWRGAGRRGRRTTRGRSSLTWSGAGAGRGLPGQCHGAAGAARTGRAGRVGPGDLPADHRPGGGGAAVAAGNPQAAAAGRHLALASQPIAPITCLQAYAPRLTSPTAPTTRKEISGPWNPGHRRQPGNRSRPGAENGSLLAASARHIKIAKRTRANGRGAYPLLDPVPLARDSALNVHRVPEYEGRGGRDVARLGSWRSTSRGRGPSRPHVAARGAVGYKGPGVLGPRRYLFLFWALAIAEFVFAARVKPALMGGDVAGAQRASKRVVLLFWISVAVFVVWIIIVAIAASHTNSSSGY